MILEKHAFWGEACAKVGRQDRGGKESERACTLGRNEGRKESIKDFLTPDKAQRSVDPMILIILLISIPHLQKRQRESQGSHTCVCECVCMYYVYVVCVNGSC